MPAFATFLGILLVLLSIPFGLMLAPLALGVIVIFLGWRHVSAGLQTTPDGAPA